MIFAVNYTFYHFAQLLVEFKCNHLGRSLIHATKFSKFPTCLIERCRPPVIQMLQKKLKVRKRPNFILNVTTSQKDEVLTTLLGYHRL